MATVTLYRCTVPHFQGDLHVPIGAVYPEGSPEVAGDLAAYFVVEEHTVEAKKATAEKKA